MGASGIGCLGGDSGGMQSRHVGDKESHHQQKLASHYGSDLWATETTGPHASKQVDPQGRRNITLSLSSQVANPLWLPLPGHAVHVAALALHASGPLGMRGMFPAFGRVSIPRTNAEPWAEAWTWAAVWKKSPVSMLW
mmetsp:Transcript_52976/g.120744  ORF Transcript_52976/g.120744 Transcript_52976/m.120744 type:complete len:138 (+) Transcript_52976:144-557(+)